MFAFDCRQMLDFFIEMDINVVPFVVEQIDQCGQYSNSLCAIIRNACLLVTLESILVFEYDCYTRCFANVTER